MICIIQKLFYLNILIDFNFKTLHFLHYIILYYVFKLKSDLCVLDFT